MKTTVAHGDAESAMVDDGVDTESITGDDGVGKARWLMRSWGG